MKVTAILPDNLINTVKKLSKGKNITESLKIALREWVDIKRIKQLNSKIAKNPLNFEYSAAELRNLNRSI